MSCRFTSCLKTTKCYACCTCFADAPAVCTIHSAIVYSGGLRWTFCRRLALRSSRTARGMLYCSMHGFSRGCRGSLPGVTCISTVGSLHYQYCSNQCGSTTSRSTVWCACGTKDSYVCATPLATDQSRTVTVRQRSIGFLQNLRST